VYSYDDRGRVSAETVWIDGNSYDTAYTYDAADRMVTMTYPGGSEVVTTTWNMQGLPETMSGSSTYVAEANYNALGQVNLLDLGSPGGLQTSYVYHGEADSPDAEDDNFRLWQVRTTNGGTTHLQLEYAYDSVGNVQSITDVGKGSQVQTFGYDSLDRLPGAEATGGSVPTYTQTYSYTKVGNIDDFDGRAYAYEGSGHLHAQPHAVTSAGSDTFTYDEGDQESLGT